MDLQLAGKAVLVTGASGGIGRAIAEAFAAEGALLALGGNAHFAELQAWLAARPWREQALAVRADVTVPEEMERALGETVERFGRVDVCVANAGTWPPGDLRLDELPVERLRRTIDANLFGAIWTARAFLGALRRTGPRPDGHGAAAALIGSTAGRFGERGHADYATAKAALRGLVRTLKNEIVALDPWGRVNMVEPGWTATEMARESLTRPGLIESVVRTMPLRQIARAKDIARAVVVLCSPAASRHVTGEVLTVAGGMEGRVLSERDEIDPAAVRWRLDQE